MTSNFDSRLGFVRKVNEQDEASRKGDIDHRHAARQTIENVMRIAQNGFVEVVKKLNILIPAWLFKVKLTSEEMVIKACPAKSQIERMVRFQF